MATVLQRLRRLVSVWFCWFAVVAQADDVSPIPDSLRREFNLAPFYQQHLLVGGLPATSAGIASPLPAKRTHSTS